MVRVGKRDNEIYRKCGLKDTNEWNCVNVLLTLQSEEFGNSCHKGILKSEHSIFESENFMLFYSRTLSLHCTSWTSLTSVICMNMKMIV